MSARKHILNHHWLMNRPDMWKIKKKVQPTGSDSSNEDIGIRLIRVIKRQILPSIGGSPYLPRGLRLVGSREEGTYFTTSDKDQLKWQFPTTPAHILQRTDLIYYFTLRYIFCSCWALNAIIYDFENFISEFLNKSSYSESQHHFYHDIWNAKTCSSLCNNFDSFWEIVTPFGTHLNFIRNKCDAKIRRMTNSNTKSQGSLRSNVVLGNIQWTNS